MLHISTSVSPPSLNASRPFIQPSLQVERRHRAKELMAAAEERGEVPPPGGAAEQAERLARLERLRELRERLAGSSAQQTAAA